jgi:hypothetical protein
LKTRLASLNSASTSSGSKLELQNLVQQTQDKTLELNPLELQLHPQSQQLLKSPASELDLRDVQGSATGEFVLIALPLFLPALLFFLAMSQIARAEMETTFIAREAVRAFTTGSDDDSAHARVRSLLSEYDLSPISYRVLCSTQPCITPGAEVELTVFEELDDVRLSEGSITSGSNFWNSKETRAIADSNRNEDAEKSSGKDAGEGGHRRAIASARGFVDKWQ